MPYTKRTTPKPQVSSITAGPVALPARPPKAGPGLGASAPAQAQAPEIPGQRRISAREAGDLCPAFGRPHANGDKGGEAFAAWFASTGGSPDTRLTLAEWQSALDTFSQRPIYGHRRKATGGPHRINREDLR